MSEFTKVYGATTKQQAPFLSTDDVDGLPEWNAVSIISVKEAVDKNGQPFLWITFKERSNDWVTRQAYFGETTLYPLLKLWDIHEGIDRPDKIIGKSLYITIGIRKSKDGRKEYVTIDGYRLTDKPVDIKEKLIPEGGGDVPF